jgi:hypothetical protein
MLVETLAEFSIELPMGPILAKSDRNRICPFARALKTTMFFQENLQIKNAPQCTGHLSSRCDHAATLKHLEDQFLITR